ncbi:MAG: hypothetical protein CVU88_07710 [Firmicutes bacterium HGW-Firmicutes-13]|nr:MAG: hypothetical protein CVU88_07710 [Firmicutes bacterium HGW-Firmicutes-13]
MIPNIARILKNDGKESIYSFLNSTDNNCRKSYLEILAKGNRDADLPFSGGYICHMKHFHHPWSHRGYLSRNKTRLLAGFYCLKTFNVKDKTY